VNDTVLRDELDGTEVASGEPVLEQERDNLLGEEVVRDLMPGFVQTRRDVADVIRVTRPAAGFWNEVVSRQAAMEHGTP
jgi:hypothetical protein